MCGFLAGDASSVGWTRQVEATGNHPVGAMVNAWE
jgi:hypothetical protein